MTGATSGSTIMETIGGLDMGGVVAGGTMKDISRMLKKWGALMVNECCNLDCPRCYLGVKNSYAIMSRGIAKGLLAYAKKHWAGVVFIGTEPLLDERSVEIVSKFAAEIRTHLITNGVNLEKFAGALKKVRRIDISLDGGARTYCRSPNFQQILDGAKKWKILSRSELYLLHVLSRENCRPENIADMIAAKELFGADDTVFSPYIQTIGGRSEMGTVPIAEISRSLKDFSEEEWTIILDPYHALLENRSWDKIKEDVSDLPQKNVLIFDLDPGDRIVRVDIDGRAHHPFLALHPGVKLPGVKLF